MRRILFALLLTLAFAGAAQAQERVRTGPQPRAAAAPATQRALPVQLVRDVKQRSLVPSRAKSGPAVRAAAMRADRAAPSRRGKRPAPRD